MVRRKKQSKWAGLVVGPILVFLAITTLWKNETRYDYYREAKRTTPVEAINDAEPEELISLTGSMDQGAEIAGTYVEQFTGYLVVYRSAEIFAWDKDEDDDGNVSWNQKWMSNLESNSRNSGIKQIFDSGELMPDQFVVGELIVESTDIEFVDSSESIDIEELTISQRGLDNSLEKKAGYLYLSKNGNGENIGDERISFRGVPIPPEATYFGKFLDGRGVAYDDHRRTGLVSQIIQDTGVLHHIVAGDRDTALTTIKQYLSMVKWIVRGVGTIVVFLGFMAFFGTMLKFLFPIPFIGRIAEWGVILVSLAFGLPLAGMTIAASYLFAHPLILLVLIFLMAVAVYFLRGKGQKAQTAIKKDLYQHYGREIQQDDFKVLEFRELIHLAMSDSDLGIDERDFLYDWGARQGWDRAQCDKHIEEVKSKPVLMDSKTANDSHLESLIKLSLVDGNLTAYEMKTIRIAAEKAGYDRQAVRDILDEVRRTANQQGGLQQAT